MFFILSLFLVFHPLFSAGFRVFENQQVEMVNKKKAAFLFTLRYLCLGTEQHNLRNSGSIALWHRLEVCIPSFSWEECLLSLVL